MRSNRFTFLKDYHQIKWVSLCGMLQIIDSGEIEVDYFEEIVNLLTNNGIEENSIQRDSDGNLLVLTPTNLQKVS